ncbi:MAG TPA: protein kinase [Candidatus Limnocylindria bacterium]|nr:protein kinase [Candidatus Limnocylindria bacterium]
MTLSPGATLGNYQIVEKIGAGGMGSVYKAYQPALGRYVAIKVLPPQTAGDPSFAERFALEARAIGKLRHPNIVTAYDFAQQGDLAYLVSDFIDGGTLAEQLGTPLPLEYALTILTPIGSALDYAHARGVVHRDIKPQNILLSHDGTPVLTDFGLAKIIGPGSGVTQAGALMGTAEYIAPECASGAESAGPAADQYAIGIVAYQMLVGRHPFPSENPLSALMAHVHKPVPAPSAIGVELPPHVEAAVLRALAKKPGERFPRVSDFVRALASPVPQMGSAPKLDAPPQPVSIPPAPRATLPPAQPALSVSTDRPRPVPVVAAPAKRRPLWRRKRVLVPAGVVAVLLVLAVLNGREGRQAGGPPTVTSDDHGNSAVAASVISAGTTSGTISLAGDVDWFRVNVNAGTNIVAELHMGTLGSGSITILSPSAQVLDDATEGAGKTARVSYQARDAGSYFIRVRAGRSDATGTYSIVLTTR